MTKTTPSFTLGIEEEYLLVDETTLDLVSAPDGLMESCAEAIGDKVSPEFLQCQIEVGTGICRTVAEAREDLAHLRRTVADCAGEHGIAPIAVSTHPFAKWQAQSFTDKERYRSLEKDMAQVARRMLICGMHVHVGIEDDDLRVDLLNQFTYFLPHLLALSTSSPFWEGDETGLRSYRLSVFDNLPRTGLPPLMSSFSEYTRAVNTLIDCEIVEDASKIWWDLRPSSSFPTLESRICDVSPRLDDTITLAAITQSAMCMLHSLHKQNMRWRQYHRFLLEENRWRAQRYGAEAGLIDFGIGEIVLFADLLDELLVLLRPHAAALGCLAELERAPQILERGTSATRQLATFHDAQEGGAGRDEALRAVVRTLVEEFREGL